jgi:hypothetical protein
VFFFGRVPPCVNGPLAGGAREENNACSFLSALSAQLLLLTSVLSPEEETSWIRLMTDYYRACHSSGRNSPASHLEARVRARVNLYGICVDSVALGQAARPIVTVTVIIATVLLA